jgi:hypothetical protein
VNPHSARDTSRPSLRASPPCVTGYPVPVARLSWADTDVPGGVIEAAARPEPWPQPASTPTPNAPHHPPTTTSPADHLPRLRQQVHRHRHQRPHPRLPLRHLRCSPSIRRDQYPERFAVSRSGLPIPPPGLRLASSIIRLMRRRILRSPLQEQQSSQPSSEKTIFTAAQSSLGVDQVVRNRSSTEPSPYER